MEAARKANHGCYKEIEAYFSILTIGRVFNDSKRTIIMVIMIEMIAFDGESYRN